MKKIPYFKSLTLNITWPERFIFRSVTYITYITLTFATLTFTISDVKYLKWLGLLIAIFLIDRFINRHQGLSKISNHDTNLAHHLNPSALNILERSLDKSSIQKKPIEISLLENIFNIASINKALERLEIKHQDIKQYIAKLENKPQAQNKKESLKTIEKIVKNAYQEAKLENKPFITENEITLATLNIEHEIIKKINKLFSLSPEDLKKALIWQSYKNKFNYLKKIPSSIGGFVYNIHNPKGVRIINRAWTSRPTPTLDKFGLDLTAKARQEKIGLLIGHQNEYQEMENILSKKTQGNVLLVGDPKIGKKTLVSHLAWKITRDQVKPALFDMRLISLDIARLLSNLNDSEANKKIQTIIKEIISSKNIILYINKIDLLLKSNSQNTTSIADTLNEVFNNEHFKIIGSITKSAYKHAKDNDNSFVSNFETIAVNEITKEETERVLIIKSLILENQNNHKILITIPAIKKATLIGHKYLHDTPLPESAIRIIEEAVEEALTNEENKINENTVISIAERKINIPLRTTDNEEAQKLLNLENLIHQKFIDQNEAVSAVAGMLRQHRSGLSRSKAPIASFLFVGPTGVGKTELAKILAEYQFGSYDHIIRFDMTEFQDESSITRFIGNEKRNGQLTEAVKQKPYSLILLDEFEKANLNIINIFLQIFDDGQLTDTFGSKTIFENTMIIATSNAHSDFIIKSIKEGQTIASISNELKNKLTSIFKPELLNRFSKIIVFKNLSEEDTLKITKLKLEELSLSLDQTKGITLKFTAKTIQTISQIGYSPIFGARPLREAINENLKDPIAKKILKNEIEKGDTLEIDSQNGKFLFRKV